MGCSCGAASGSSLPIMNSPEGTSSISASTELRKSGYFVRSKARATGDVLTRGATTADSFTAGVGAGRPTGLAALAAGDAPAPTTDRCAPAALDRGTGEGA